MAEYAQVSKHQVTAIWKAADLKPHRIRSFKISNDPDFAALCANNGETLLPC